MKKNLLFYVLIISLCQLAEAGKPKIIDNPYYEVNTSGIYNIARVELTGKSTRLHIFCHFIPNWWVMFDKESKITDDLGNEYLPLAIEGAKFDEKLWMPEDGDSTVVLVYEPLSKKARKIDYDDTIYGISLRGEDEKKHSSDTPEKIRQWISEEISKASAKGLLDLEKDNLFAPAPAKIVGYIKGYDKRTNLKTGILYLENQFTKESYPKVVEVYEDGRFEVELDLLCPLNGSFSMNREYIPFYLEPGHTLGIELDWEEFLVADRKRNISYNFKDIDYSGPLAELNHELLSYDRTSPNYRGLSDIRKTTYPKDFKADQLKLWDEELVKLDSYVENNSVSKKAYSILKDQVDLKYGTFLFDFASSRSYYAKKDSTNEVLNTPLAPSYYSFTDRIDLNSAKLTIHSEYTTFINRYEYNSFYQNYMQWTNEPDWVVLLKSKWAYQDSVAYDGLNWPPSITHDITKIRALDYEFGLIKSKKEALAYWEVQQKSISEPFLIKEGSRMLDKNHPDPGISSASLPDSKGKDTFERIISPHRGKVLFVDFWATSCGPCVSGIKRMKDKRTEMKTRDDIAFLFITDERSSPETKYNQFVEDQEMEITYRVPTDEFHYLRELFKFNGIPKYVVIDPEGRVFDDDFAMYNFNATHESVIAQAKEQ